MYNTNQLPSGEVEEIIEAESWDAPLPFSIFPLLYLLIPIFIIAFCVGIYYGFGCMIDTNCLMWLR